MKNIPNRIYLQTGLEEYGETCGDFNELNSSLVSWCADKIYSDDLECEQIADDFAIGFAEWLPLNEYWWNRKTKMFKKMFINESFYYTTKELLEIYKKSYENKNRNRI